MALLGPTGAGKTTLLRLLTGVENADDGLVQLSGAPLSPQSALSRLRDIAMVPQRPVLLDGSVETNVAFGLSVRGQPTDGKVRDVLNRLQLARFARQAARSLSGGQAQLVALARALVLEPKVLLLDEPTANLDSAYVALVEQVIRDAQASQETTVIWATHNLFQARRMSHRVTLLLDGNIVEVAENGAFFSSPSDPRSHDFIHGKTVY
jgi:tungstate transport system ATP-binding protein